MHSLIWTGATVTLQVNGSGYIFHFIIIFLHLQMHRQIVSFDKILVETPSLPLYLCSLPLVPTMWGVRLHLRGSLVFRCSLMHTQHPPWWHTAPAPRLLRRHSLTPLTTQRRERETGVSSVAREGGAFKGRRESETARVHHSLERASMPVHVKADAFD